MDTIVENNRIIAEFMGLLESSIANKYWTKKSIEGFGTGEMVELLYHSSWDWLLPVLERIKETQRNGNSYYSHLMNTTVSMLVSNGIEATYVNVVKFIKWYNTQTK